MILQVYLIEGDDQVDLCMTITSLSSLSGGGSPSLGPPAASVCPVSGCAPVLSSSVGSVCSGGGSATGSMGGGSVLGRGGGFSSSVKQKSYNY